MTASMTILLVEDDATLRRAVSRGLTEQGYDVQAAGSLERARTLAGARAPDLALLDLGLPDGDGLSLLRELRERWPSLPILLLTARDALDDKIRGLDAGADDYLVKPFDFQELLARIRAQQRRVRAAPEANRLTVADLDIDLLQREVRRGGAEIVCTPREFDVLVHLARTPGEVVSRQRLAADVWKVTSRMTSMDNVIDVLMSRLREKVDGPGQAKLLHTVRGLGFLLKEPS